MRNIHLVFLICSILCITTVQAAWITGAIGPSRFNTQHRQSSKLQFTHVVPSCNLEIGANLNNTFRHAALFTHNTIMHSKESGKHNITPAKVVMYKLSGRTRIYSVSYAIYADVFKTANFNLFLGTAGGVAKEHSKFKGVNDLSGVGVAYDVPLKPKKTRYLSKMIVGCDYSSTDTVSNGIVYHYTTYFKTHGTKHDVILRQATLISHTLLYTVKFMI